MNSTIPPRYHSTVLVGVAVALAGTVPTTLAAIPDPTIKALATSAVLLIVVYLCWKAPPPGMGGVELPKYKHTGNGKEDDTDPQSPQAKRYSGLPGMRLA